MKLLLIPLAVMLLIATLCMLGFPNTAVDMTDQTMGYYKGYDDLGNKLYLYSSSGVPICYYDQTPVYSSPGSVIAYEANGYYPQEAAWSNSTGYYQLYYDTSGAEPVFWVDLTPAGSFARPTERAGIGTWTFGGALGFIGLVGVLMFVGTLVGIRFFGIGESEESVSFLLKGTFFITVWVALTGLAYPIILSGNWVIYVIYFGLTVIYAIGIINQVGHPGND